MYICIYIYMYIMYPPALKYGNKISGHLWTSPISDDLSISKTPFLRCFSSPHPWSTRLRVKPRLPEMGIGQSVCVPWLEAAQAVC